MIARVQLGLLVPLFVGALGGGSGCHRAQGAPDASPPAWFVESAAQAGIRFRHVNGANGKYYYPETNGSGCAWFDADGDGWIDAVLVNSAPLPDPEAGRKALPGLYLNNRDGTFRDVTAGSGLDRQMYGTGCSAGDYDNDGRTDLYVGNALGPGRLYRNVGGGKFKDESAALGPPGRLRWSTASAWLDYDNDGLLDLFVGSYIRYKLGSDTPCLYSEGYKTYCGPGWFQPDHPVLYRNLGASGGRSRFEDVTARTGLLRLKQKALGVAVLDYNGDHWPDLFVTNDVWEQHLLQNSGGAGRREFREVGVDQGVAYPESGKSLAGMGVSVADLLGDGRLWVATSNFSGEGVAIFRQDRQGGPFRDVSRSVGVTQASLPLLGFGLGWLDADNSGIEELLGANGHVHPDVHKHQPHLEYEQPKLLLEWDGQSRFRDVTAQAGPALTDPNVSRGLAVGDYDNDGRLDVLVNNVGRPAQLFRNTRPSAGHWLGLKLEGRKSNRSGYGAEVTVRTVDRIQRDTCTSGGSYCSHSDTRLHFGLGQADRVAEIRVRWPSGTTDVIRDVAADAYYRLVEGTSLLDREVPAPEGAGALGGTPAGAPGMPAGMPSGPPGGAP